MTPDVFFFSFGSNNLLNYDKQHNNNIAPMEKKSILKTYMFTHSSLSISHTKNHYSTSLIIIFLLNKISKKKKNSRMDLYVEESIHITTIFKNIQNYELKNLLLHSIYNLSFNSFGKSNILIYSNFLI